MKTLLSILGLLLLSSTLTASTGPQPKTTMLPKVFVLGEHEELYNQLVEQTPESILDACACSTEQAFAKWVGMLNELDAYSRKQNVDIRGVKLWIHVFVAPDGKIKHLAYHLRPNSREMDNEALAGLMEGFTRQYHFPITSDKGFQHYSTGSFPVFGELIGKSE